MKRVGVGGITSCRTLSKTLYKSTNPTTVRNTPGNLLLPVAASAGVWRVGEDRLCRERRHNADMASSGVVMQTPWVLFSFADITDGISATALLGEKQLNSRVWRCRRQQRLLHGGLGKWEVYRGGLVQPEQDFHDNNTDAHDGFSSARFRFNVLFCDGSVRHLRYSVDLTTIGPCVRFATTTPPSIPITPVSPCSCQCDNRI